MSFLLSIQPFCSLRFFEVIIPYATDANKKTSLVLLVDKRGFFYGPSDWIRTEQPAGGGAARSGWIKRRFAPDGRWFESFITNAKDRRGSIPNGLLVRVTGFEPAAS